MGCIVLERTVCVLYIKLGTLQVHKSSKIVQSELQFEVGWRYLDGGRREAQTWSTEWARKW
jgi:hypothetical protein